MARVVYTIPVSELRGSIGGTTFQQNKSGFICRAKPQKCNSLTFDRNVVNNYFYYLEQKFQTLSSANRTLWNDYADAWTYTDRYGNEKHLTAFNWFILINSNHYHLSGGYTDVPLGHELPDAIGSYVLNLYANTVQIIFTATPSNPLTAAFIFTTAPMMRITTSFRGKLKLTKVMNPHTTKEIDITTEWKDVHNLNYPPVASTDRFYVGICICSCHNVSGVTGAYLCGRSYFDNLSGGIGDMIIDTDFIVT